MSEDSNQEEPSVSEEAAADPGVKNQLLALFTLLPVLGLLWLLIQYLPAVGDWMGEAADKVVGTEEPGDREDKASPSEPDIPVLASGTVEATADTKGSYREQIVEQLGGSGTVELRHLAISDDREKMVAALELAEESGGKRLIEIFFERDEFGRYLSTEDSPLDFQIKLWGE
ncbi:MAG: hypothetical protein P1U68_17980 [Verrucomicrobiales bacterium]|nr:hypothetical protein [Verrucomicrobiales bacterium]